MPAGGLETCGGGETDKTTQMMRRLAAEGQSRN